MIDPYLVSWARAFALTSAVEVPIAVALLRTDDAKGLRAARCFFASLATHPAVWFLFPALGVTYTAQVTASELWALFAEAIYYEVVFRVGWRRALGVSLVANGASFALGLALQAAGVLR